MSTEEKSKLWKQATDKYKNKFTAEEITVIGRITDSSLLVSKFNQKHPSSAGKNDDLKTITNGLKRLGGLLTLFTSAIPEVSILLWGSIDLIYERSNVSQEVNTIIAQMIIELCELAPRLHTYEKVFANMEAVEISLIRFYTASLDFFAEANEYIKRCSSRSYKIGPLPAPIQLRKHLETIKTRKHSVEQEAFAANLSLHAKWHEELHDILTNVNIQSKSTAPCKIVPYPENQKFSGRKDILNLLESNLVISNRNQRSFALHGLGGVGKTQIALKYIYDHIEDFPFIFWMHAQTQTKLSRSFIDAAKSLQLEPEDSQSDTEAVVSVLKTWLGQSKDNWLIVFDNADNLDILKPFWPAGNCGTILLTSRDPASALLAKNGTRVNPLSAQEGEELFLSLITQSSDYEDIIQDSSMVKEITKSLGYLPLAINQVASFVIERDCTLEDFNEIYKEASRSTEGFSELDTSTANFFYEHSLATVWRISITSLHPESAKLLAILANFDADGIPETLLREGSKEIPELSFLSKTTQYSNAQSQLLRNGLITKSNTVVRINGVSQNKTSIRSISVHRLVQETVFHQQNPTEQNDNFLSAATLLQKVFPRSTPSNWRMMHHWAECERYLPHVVAIEDRCHDSPNLQLKIGLAEVFFHAGWYLYERRIPEMARPLLQTALKICEHDTEANTLKTRVLTALGCVAFDTYHFDDAKTMWEKVLAIRRATSDPEDVLLAHALNDLALAYTAYGDFVKAISLQEEAVRIVENNPDDFTRRDMMFHLYHNMGRTYEAKGNPKEALRLHLFQGDVQGNGLRQENTASGATNIYAVGNCYLALGDRQGIEYHTRALKIRRELVGNHYMTAVSLHKMGCILHQSGTLDEANEAFSQAYEIFESSVDAQREMARTAYHWSLTKRDKNQQADAERLRKLAWKLRTEITGEEQNKEEVETSGFDRLVIYLHA